MKKFLIAVMALFLVGFCHIVTASTLMTLAQGGYQVKYGYSNKYGVITPSNVYVLAITMNKLLTKYAQLAHFKNHTRLTQLKELVVQNKTPTDVFQLIKTLANRLDAMIKMRGGVPVQRLKTEKAKAVPAEPFIFLSHCIDGFVTYLHALYPRVYWGNFYLKRRLKENKTPSDVYSIVDLAVRRANLILQVLKKNQ